MSEDRTSTPFQPGTSLDKAVPSQSKYLAKEDVDPPIIVQIAYMTQDEVDSDGKLEIRAVLNFDGDIKPMILNQTNKELLKAVTGATTVDGVRGKQIILYNDRTIMFGKQMVGGIRIRAAQQHHSEPVSHVPVMPGTGSQDFDDDIPY